MVKAWLKDNEFKEFPVISWNQGAAFDEIYENGFKVKALIGSAEERIFRCDGIFLMKCSPGTAALVAEDTQDPLHLLRVEFVFLLIFACLVIVSVDIFKTFARFQFQTA